MSSLNRVSIIGNLGRDPEVRSTNTGSKVCTLSVACTEKWKDKNSGEQREKTEWIRCVLFERLADIAEQYLRSGSKIYLEGKFITRKWEDSAGQERYSTEVVCSGFDGKLIMLDGKKEAQGEPQGSSSAPPAGDLNDDVPFMPDRGL